MIDGICRQLLDFYRSGERQLRRFAMQYIPTLVFLHLTDKSYTAVQTLLVSLYNLEVKNVIMSYNHLLTMELYVFR